MYKPRNSDSQIMDALKRGEACLVVPDVLEVISATFYKWRSKYGDMDVSMMPRL